MAPSPRHRDPGRDLVDDLLRPIHAHRERQRRRDLADDCLLSGAVPREASELLAWRAAELRSDKHRSLLAKGCRRWLSEIDGPRCRAYAVNRRSMREHRQLFIQLAEHLKDKNQALPLRGLILADQVLGDNGLLSDPARSDEIGPTLQAALKSTS